MNTLTFSLCIRLTLLILCTPNSPDSLHARETAKPKVAAGSNGLAPGTPQPECKLRFLLLLRRLVRHCSTTGLPKLDRCLHLLLALASACAEFLVALEPAGLILLTFVEALLIMMSHS